MNLGGSRLAKFREQRRWKRSRGKGKNKCYFFLGYIIEHDKFKPVFQQELLLKKDLIEFPGILI
jgi:hypothetical protein